ncbi:restriction endonuclease subunit S [Telluria mixta]|uniref:Restriction endonuclease subunit S n=1 Tax=Telluria mixta TaxID=34071 RepID=A0ABT2C5V6_9BURK|nr:restriction endonuclease subunit S [Telluria mixta]MCS0632769.1 restriction endonuclease subunit S [Telluria mixta]WEM97846.1 restriction endonuclease subunit S [Telluria mixta]
MRLPETWVEARLGDILTRLDTKVDPQTSQLESHFYVGLEHIESHTGRLLREVEEVTEGSSILSIKTAFEAGDILYGKLRPNLNKVHMATQDGICSTDIWALRTSEAVLPDFALRYLRSPVIYVRATQLAAGANLPRLSAEAFDRFPIPLPTLPEQQRIVDVLQQTEAIAKLRSTFDELLIRTKQQLFVEMFGDPSPKINTRWPIAKLGKFVTIATGGTPSREQADNYGPAHAWVKSTDLKDNLIAATEERVSDLGIQRSNAKLYPKQTVMLAMYGQGQTRGRTGKLLVDAACNQACAALLPSDELLPDYLWIWLQLSYDAVRALGRGGQQENLNLDIIRSIALPKPPIPLQQEFARRLDSLQELFKLSRKAAERFSALQEVLQIEALTGYVTASWREMHSAEIAKAVHTRDALLRERGAKIALGTNPAATATTQADLPARHWLLNELSEFQRQVLVAFTEYCQQSGQPLLVEVPEVFASFCDDPAVTERLQTFGSSHGNRIRRSLSQLAALGLITKVTLPKQDPESGKRDYLKAFRPLRPDEFTRLTDVRALRKALSFGADGEAG